MSWDVLAGVSNLSIRNVNQAAIIDIVQTSMPFVQAYISPQRQSWTTLIFNVDTLDFKSTAICQALATLFRSSTELILAFSHINVSLFTPSGELAYSSDLRHDPQVELLSHGVEIAQFIADQMNMKIPTEQVDTVRSATWTYRHFPQAVVVAIGQLLGVDYAGLHYQLCLLNDTQERTGWIPGWQHFRRVGRGYGPRQ